MPVHSLQCFPRCDLCLWHQHSWELWPEVTKADLSLPEGEKVTPLSALGAFHFLLWGFCWVVGFQLCNSQLDPWICAEFSANSPSLLLFAVLPVPLLQLSQEGEDICAPFLCLFLQHLLVWIKEPLANLLPHRSGFSFLLPDPDKAAPGEAAWLWCMKKKNQTTWGLLLCFYNSFLYSLGQK